MVRHRPNITPCGAIRRSLLRMRTSNVCVFITAVPIIKLFAWGEGDSGGHVQQETTSRGLCGLVCPSRNPLVNTGRGRSCERRRGRRRGAREGAYTGAATMQQSSTLRLIQNAAALAAASPTCGLQRLVEYRALETERV